MRRLAILLTIGIFWFGGLHPDFVIANGHTGLHGQVESICGNTHSTNSSCPIHGNQSEIINSTFNNSEKPFLKVLDSYLITSLPVSYDGWQIKQKFLGDKSSIDEIKLTDTVIKRE